MNQKNNFLLTYLALIKGTECRMLNKQNTFDKFYTHCRSHKIMTYKNQKIECKYGVQKTGHPLVTTPGAVGHLAKGH
jgi:hypothetical protein